MDRISIYLEDYQLDTADSIKEETWQRDDLPRIDNRSEVIRMILDLGLGALDELEGSIEDDEISIEMLSELIPDHTIIDYRREQLKAEAKPLFRGSKIAERFSDKCDELFTGEVDTKATPETVSRIADKYLAELSDLEEIGVLDEDSIRRQRRAINERVETYREEFATSEFAPEETMRDTPEEVVIGSQIQRLHDDKHQFVLDLSKKASSSKYQNPEDLIGSLAYEYGVNPDAIEMFLDSVTPDGTSGRQALKSGSGVDVPEIDVPQIEDGSVDMESDQTGSEDAARPDGGQSETVDRDPDLDDLGDQDEQDDDESKRVGPVIMSNETAREQLESESVVLSFRSSDRTTGETHYRYERTGSKQGDVLIERATDEIEPTVSELRRYNKLSGFDSPEDWIDAIEELHGDSSGYIYRIEEVDR